MFIGIFLLFLAIAGFAIFLANMCAKDYESHTAGFPLFFYGVAGFCVLLGIVLGTAASEDVKRSEECESKGGYYIVEDQKCVPDDFFIELDD